MRAEADGDCSAMNPGMSSTGRAETDEQTDSVIP